MPMSRYFSETIIVKMARMLKPATPTIMKSRMLRMPRSTSMAERRALALFPTIDADVRVGEELAELVRHVELVDLVVPELDLESGAAVLHAANGLELFERHVDEARVVLAHLGLHVVGDQEGSQTGLISPPPMVTIVTSSPS